MAAVLLLEEQVEIPADVRSLADFRRWARSDDFPQRGRIDYLRARIEVDMSPEDFFCHGTLKTENQSHPIERATSIPRSSAVDSGSMETATSAGTGRLTFGKEWKSDFQISCFTLRLRRRRATG